MPDYLFCGMCHVEFQLSDIIEFINHKQSKCTISNNEPLKCYHCSNSFKTALSLLCHLQEVHNFKLLQESIISQTTSDKTSSLAEINCEQHISKENSGVEHTMTYANHPDSVSDPTCMPFPKRQSQRKSITCMLDGSTTSKCCLDFDNNEDSKETCCLNNDIEIENDSSGKNEMPFLPIIQAKQTLEETNTCCLNINSQRKGSNCCLDTKFLSNSIEENNNNNNSLPKLVELDFDVTEIFHETDNASNAIKQNTINGFTDIIHNDANSINAVNINEFSMQTNSSEITSNSSQKIVSKPTYFMCNYCTKSFNQKIHLNKHIMKEHKLDGKPFKCDLCNYATVEKSHLKVHKRKHTGEKPFQCRVCGYCATQNCTLKHHYIKRHPESKTNCVNCQKKFITDREREKHERNCKTISSNQSFGNYQ